MQQYNKDRDKTSQRQALIQRYPVRKTKTSERGNANYNIINVAKGEKMTEMIKRYPLQQRITSIKHAIPKHGNKYAENN